VPKRNHYHDRLNDHFSMQPDGGPIRECYARLCKVFLFPRQWPGVLQVDRFKPGVINLPRMQIAFNKFDAKSAAEMGQESISLRSMGLRLDRVKNQTKVRIRKKWIGRSRRNCIRMLKRHIKPGVEECRTEGVKKFAAQVNASFFDRSSGDGPETGDNRDMRSGGESAN